MKRKTHLFLVAVDEDPIAGSFDKEHIFGDVEAIIKRSIISAYEPRVVGLGNLTRESNFVKDTEVELSMAVVHVIRDDDYEIDLEESKIVISTTIEINYEASNNEMLGEDIE